MALDTEWSRGNPEHVLFLDPFKEPFWYFVVELCHGAKTMVCFGRQVGAEWPLIMGDSNSEIRMFTVCR